MKQNSVFCEKCGSYSIAENYRKELDRMEDGEVIFCCCCECGCDNPIERDGDDYRFFLVLFEDVFGGEE